MAETFSVYETWLTNQAGPAHRTQNLAGWHRAKHAIPAGDMAPTWRTLAQQVRIAQ